MWLSKVSRISWFDFKICDSLFLLFGFYFSLGLVLGRAPGPGAVVLLAGDDLFELHSEVLSPSLLLLETLSITWLSQRGGARSAEYTANVTAPWPGPAAVSVLLLLLDLHEAAPSCAPAPTLSVLMFLISPGGAWRGGVWRGGVWRGGARRDDQAHHHPDRE